MWINPVAPGAEHVYDEDAVVFSMKEHLQQTAVVAKDVARAISRSRTIGVVSLQERNRPPAVLVPRKSSPEWENRSHRRWGKYGAQLCTPSIDGQMPGIIRFQELQLPIARPEQYQFRDQSLIQFQEHDDAPGWSYSNF